VAASSYEAGRMTVPTDEVASWVTDWLERELTHLWLVVGWRVGARIECARVPTSTDIADDLREVCADTLDRLSGLEPRRWSREIGPEDDEYLIATMEQVGLDSPLLAALSTADFDVLHPRTLPDRDLLFYTFIVGPPDGRLTFLRKYNPRRGLRNRLVGLFTDTLTRLVDPLFTFDDRIDLVLDLTGGAAILNLGAFEVLFRTSPEMLARTPEYVADIAAALPIDTDAAEALTAAAEANSMLRRRLQAIVERGHLATVTVADIRREMRKHKMKPTDFIKNGKLTQTSGSGCGDPGVSWGFVLDVPVGFRSVFAAAELGWGSVWSGCRGGRKRWCGLRGLAVSVFV